MADEPVLPLLEIAADDFNAQHREIEITLQGSNNRSSISAFCAGAADVALTLGTISQIDLDACKANGIEYERYEIAKDSAVIAVNRANGWVDALNDEDLRKLWAGARGEIRWSDLRKNWPDKPISTFTESENPAILAVLAQAIGSDNLILKAGPTSEIAQDPLQGLSTSANGIGIFSRSFATLHSEKLRVVHLQGIKNLDVPVSLLMRKSLVKEAPELADFKGSFQVGMIGALGYEGP